jgi:hypothetical protein
MACPGPEEANHLLDLLCRSWMTRSSSFGVVEHQIKNLVVWVSARQESDRLPDARSGDTGLKLRPHCDQATRDGRGRMPKSDRRDGR